MNFLDFRVPESTRISWVSPEAESVWAPRIDKICKAIDELEFQTVVKGKRSLMVQTVTPGTFYDLMIKARKQGLIAVTLDISQDTGSYSSSTTPYEKGKPVLFRVAVTSPVKLPLVMEAWDDVKAGNNDLLGVMLGYPGCCRRFFDEIWVKKNLIDTSWWMCKGKGEICEVEIEPKSNILLRWLGVRLVFHLPCSVDCYNTACIAQEHDNLLRELGFIQEANWILEMLSWPVEWSALHGIAEIKTPICKITANTDATAEKHTIRVKGKAYPKEGATGSVFPFRNGLLTSTWADNGFKSKQDQDRAHSMVLSALGDFKPKSVLDLGCGNGELLRKIGAEYNEGVELDPEKIKRAVWMPNAKYWTCDIRDYKFHDPFDLILIASNRLSEFGNLAGNKVLDKIKGYSKKYIVYSYDMAWAKLYNGNSHENHFDGPNR